MESVNNRLDFRTDVEVEEENNSIDLKQLLEATANMFTSENIELLTSNLQKNTNTTTQNTSSFVGNEIAKELERIGNISGMSPATLLTAFSGVGNWVKNFTVSNKKNDEVTKSLDEVLAILDDIETELDCYDMTEQQRLLQEMGMQLNNVERDTNKNTTQLDDWNNRLTNIENQLMENEKKNTELMQETINRLTNLESQMNSNNELMQLLNSVKTQMDQMQNMIQRKNKKKKK